MRGTFDGLINLQLPHVLHSQTAFGVTLAGEFSNGYNACGLFLTGTAGTSSFGSSCSLFLDASQWNQTMKDGIMEFALASMDALQNWFFWTWKVCQFPLSFRDVRSLMSGLNRSAIRPLRTQLKHPCGPTNSDCKMDGYPRTHGRHSEHVQLSAPHSNPLMGNMRRGRQVVLALAPLPPPR